MVTFAPKSLVKETDSEAALVIAAFKSKAPVMVIAPKAPLAAPPTAPPNSASLVPTLMVRALAWLASLLTVLPNVIWLFVVVKAVLAPKVTAPVYV